MGFWTIWDLEENTNVDMKRETNSTEESIVTIKLDGNGLTIAVERLLLIMYDSAIRSALVFD